MKRIGHAALLVLGHLWAAPVTFAGLLTALCGGTYYVGRRGSTLFYAARPGGLCAAFFDRFAMAAYTWGACCVLAHEWYLTGAPRLVAHERRHTWQCLVLGVLVVLAYPLAGFVAVARGLRWYWDNWFERDARAHEDAPEE